MTILVFELFGRDSSAGRTFDSLHHKVDSAGRRVRGLGSDADSANGPLSKLNSIVGNLGSSLLEGVKNGARLAIQVGAVASTALSVAPLIAKGAVEIYKFGAAAVQAAPMLLALGAAAIIVKKTLGAIGPELVKSFTPLTDGLKTATVAASALAVKGVQPLVVHFAQLNLPSISQGMNMIATSTNGVVTNFLRWGSSASGVAAIRNLMTATGAATATLVPHINRLVESFGNMIGRIAQVSIGAGAGGLGGVLDRLAGWMDRVNAATVMAGLTTLKNDFLAIWHVIQRVIEVTKTAIAFWHEHRAAIMLTQDALSILAIAFGGPVIAVAAAVGLIIRHWDDLKAAKASLQAAMASPIAVGFLENLRAASANIVPALVGAWNTIWEAIGPRLQEIWNKIKNQLIPAFGEFVAAISPLVSFLVGVLGPVVASVFDNILRIISGAISIITGIFQVFTALLTGDWAKLWEGIKNILSGAWDVIVGVLNLWIFGKIGALLGRLPGFLGGFFTEAGGSVLRAVGDWIGQLVSRIGGVPGMILRALGDLGSLLYQAGRNVVQGLINGIMSMVGAIGNAVGWIASKIRAALPFSPAKEGPLSGSGSPDIAGAKIATMIAGGMIKGVPQVVGAAYQLAGAAGMSMPQQNSLLGAGAMALAGAGRPGGYSGPPIVLQGDGTRFVELLLETIRKAVSDRGGDVQGVLGR